MITAMYNRRLSFFAITMGLCIIFSACSDDSNKDETTTVEHITTDSINLQKDKEVYATWGELYGNEDIPFSLDSFTTTNNIKGDLFTQPFEPDADYYKLYGNLLVYNADSSTFIDAYSTTWIIEEQENGVLYARAGEVDQEVAIVNTQTNIRTRLLFCGPSCIVQKAFWYNENIVGIMGMIDENNNQQYTPTIWFVNIHNGITIPYQNHSGGISQLQSDSYIKQHMESKRIKMQY